MPRKNYLVLAMLTLLIAAPCVPAQTHATSPWDIIEDATQAAIVDLWDLHTAHPEFVPPPQPPETDSEQALLRLQIVATQLGEGRARVRLELRPGTEDGGVEDLAATAREAHAEGAGRAQYAIDHWSNATLPPPGDPALEDVWAATRPAFSILEAGTFMKRMPAKPDAPAILLLVQGIETNVALLDALQPVWGTLSTPSGGNLTAADIEQVRARVRYGPALIDPKVEEWDYRSRTALADGEVNLALAYAVFAETANTNQRAYDAVFKEGYDLLPSLGNDHARWQNATPSLLLRHAQESAEAVLAIVRENATAAASSTKVQRSAGDALAGYSAVALLRSNTTTEEAGAATGADREADLPPYVALVAGLATAAFLRRRRSGRYLG